MWGGGEEAAQPRRVVTPCGVTAWPLAPAPPPPPLLYAQEGPPLCAQGGEEAVAAAADEGERLAGLYEAFEHAGGYAARSRAASLMHGLGFGAGELEQAVDAFSGGWRMRLKLARALMCRSGPIEAMSHTYPGARQ